MTITAESMHMTHIAHQIPCPRKCPCPWPDNRPTSTRDCALVELREGGGKARATGSMCPCTCLYTSVSMPRCWRAEWCPWSQLEHHGRKVKEALGDAAVRLQSPRGLHRSRNRVGSGGGGVHAHESHASDSPARGTAPCPWPNDKHSSQWHTEGRGAGKEGRGCARTTTGWGT